MWKGTLIRGNDPDTKAPVIAAIDATSKTLRINNWVWDIGTTAWVRMKQPILELAGDLTVTMGDVERILNDQYYKRMKIYAYGSGRAKYICKNTDMEAAEGDTDWFCWKLTDAALPDKEGPRLSAVDAEATIDAKSWNI